MTSKLKLISLTSSAILFTTYVFAFGHFDEKQMREHSILEFSGGVVEWAKECESNPYAYDDCSDLESWSSIVDAARYVVICWEFPKCKKTSISNFDKICTANSECNTMLKEIGDLNVKVLEECFLDYECKTKLKACYADSGCVSNIQACFNSFSEDNPACEKMEDLFPNGFLERMIEEWEQ